MVQVVALVAAVIVILFLVKRLIYVKDVNKKQKNELEQAFSRMELQHILFDAYKEPGCIQRALEKTAGIMEAETAVFVGINGKCFGEMTVWSELETFNIENLNGELVEKIFPFYGKELIDGRNSSFYEDEADTRLTAEERNLLKRQGIHSMMIVPVRNVKNNTIALLATINMRSRWKDSFFLESVSNDFMRAMNNVEAYNLIRKMGMVDALTGVKNRNSYQQYLLQCANANTDCLGCVYIDVNGLHDVNNHLGHVAGDKMLESIAGVLSEVFCRNEIFRIGGDEFVAFSMESRAEIQEKISDAIERIQKNGYNVSIGFAWQDKDWNMKSLIADAEKKMYDDKERYYKEKGNVKGVRDMNRKLEHILQEKHDADTFLSIIAPYFMGVYVVDLDTDETRIIYQPSYFTMMLEKTDYQYRRALNEYIRTYVADEEQQSFFDLLDYGVISDELSRNQIIEYRYTKKDGSRLFLRICKAENYSENKKDSFWIFEKYNG